MRNVMEYARVQPPLWPGERRTVTSNLMVRYIGGYYYARLADGPAVIIARPAGYNERHLTIQRTVPLPAVAIDVRPYILSLLAMSGGRC